jgi:hypothetical protein
MRKASGLILLPLVTPCVHQGLMQRDAVHQDFLSDTASLVTSGLLRGTRASHCQHSCGLWRPAGHLEPRCGWACSSSSSSSSSSNNDGNSSSSSVQGRHLDCGLCWPHIVSIHAACGGQLVIWSLGAGGPAAAAAAAAAAMTAAAAAVFKDGI